MDDLMNKVSALIEAHVKSEVEARDSLATRASFTAQFDAMRKERDTVVQQFEWMREERDAANRSANKYRVMWEQLHRAQSEEVGAAGQLKELLSALGLAHFDRSTIEGALKATRERDKRLVAERDDACAVRDEAVRHTQTLREQVQALEAKLLEVRKAVGGKEMVGVGDTVRCGHFTGVVTGFRANDGAIVVTHKNDRGSDTRYIQPADLTVILTAP